METGTKINFLAIFLSCVVIAFASIVFTPVGGVLMAIMIIVFWQGIEKNDR